LLWFYVLRALLVELNVNLFSMSGEVTQLLRLLNRIVELMPPRRYKLSILLNARLFPKHPMIFCFFVVLMDDL
jgi:hypothetical protein